MTTSEPPQISWRLAPAGLLPTSGQVHLFLVDLANGAPGKSLLLSPEELSRMERFHFDRDRRRYLASRVALREILGGMINRAPEAIRFRTGAHGKPSLDVPGCDLHFNLSHSEDVMLLAVSSDAEVGVDLEQVRDDMEMEPLAEHYFAPEEQWAFRLARGRERVWKFFELWTATEARLKASGAGLTGSHHPAQETWNVIPLRIQDRFAAALAVTTPHLQLECWTWPK